MAREPDSLHTFRREHRFRLDKDIAVIRCDDGAVYELERPVERDTWRFAKSFDPDGTMRNTSSDRITADAVAEVAAHALDGWGE